MFRISNPKLTCSADLIHSTYVVAALSFLVYEDLTTLDKEVEWIWSLVESVTKLSSWTLLLILRAYRKPNDSWIKWQYLFIRYSCLAVQMFVPSVPTA